MVLLVAMLQIMAVKVEACAESGDVCDPGVVDCCEGLVCVQVAPDVYQCANEECGTYDVPCNPNVTGDCCSPLICHQVALNTYKCKDETCEEHAGHECDLVFFPCCPDSGLTCTNGICQ